MKQSKANKAITIGFSLTVMAVFGSATGCSCESAMPMGDGEDIAAGYPCETSACGGTANTGGTTSTGGTPNVGGDTSAGGEGGTAGDPGTN